MNQPEYLSGHLWTLLPTIRHWVRPGIAPPAVPWSTTLVDPIMGSITLRGLFSDAPSDTCVVLIHGLGGTTDTFYCVAAAQAAQAAGIAHLRIALRGADRNGEDFYHAGLVEDLAATLRSPTLARFEHLLVMGYSLGGHMTLRYALQPSDPRVRAVAAISPPLDLLQSAEAINRPAARIYQFHVLRGLNEIYGAVAARHALQNPIERVRAARSIREWDSLTVVPRHGFASVEEYYAETSVGPRLDQLRIPALVIQSDRDPMIPRWTYERWLGRHLPLLTLRRLDNGGHVAFPAQRAIEREALAWLLRTYAGASDSRRRAPAL